jgi:hypothetical protein
MAIERRPIVGIIQRDWEQRVNDKAEALAQERYHQDFCNLPPRLEIRLWIEAENTISDEMAAELDAAQAEERAKGGHHWDDLELERRRGN